MEEDSDESVVGAVVDAVAARERVDPVELPPLYDVVDTDALNALFDRSGERGASERTADEGSGNRLRVTLQYQGYDVEIHGGRVEVTTTTPTV
jgi:hypothetical protein